MIEANPEATSGTSRRQLPLAAVDGRRGAFAVFVASLHFFGLLGIAAIANPGRRRSMTSTPDPGSG